jgi:hypothetical protein
LQNISGGENAFRFQKVVAFDEQIQNSKENNNSDYSNEIRKILDMFDDSVGAAS